MSMGEKPTPHDIEVVSGQLGRPARDIVGIPARCVCGNPLVVATNPRLEAGTPFPTLYYLTPPATSPAPAPPTTAAPGPIPQRGDSSPAPERRLTPEQESTP